MVEKDPVAGVEAVCFSVIDGVPVSGDFGGSIGRSGVKRSGLRLGRRSRAEHLRGTGLVVLDSAGIVSHVRPDSLEEAERSSSDDISSVVRDLEGDSNVGLSSKVVDLVRLDNVEPTAEGGGIREISVVELHQSFVGIVWIHVDVVDSLRVVV